MNDSVLDVTVADFFFNPTNNDPKISEFKLSELISRKPKREQTVDEMTMIKLKLT
jgi:hypothetical protein